MYRQSLSHVWTIYFIVFTVHRMFFSVFLTTRENELTHFMFKKRQMHMVQNKLHHAQSNVTLLSHLSDTNTKQTHTMQRYRGHMGWIHTS